jgi:hypothetical protein
MEWFYNRMPVAGADDLIRACGASALSSPFRSTVPLLSVLKYDQDALLDQVTLMLGGAAEALHLEFTVAPPKGRGKASHTDAMVFTKRRALAIEAKWTEPRYPDVASWLAQGGENRAAVVAGWLSLLGQPFGKVLEARDVMDFPYQLVHRAASACATDLPPGLAYLQFSNAELAPAMAWVREDLKQLRSLAGNQDSFPIRILGVSLRPTAHFSKIASLSKGDESTGVEVSNALLSGRLFEMSDWTHETI